METQVTSVTRTVGSTRSRRFALVAAALLYAVQAPTFGQECFDPAGSYPVGYLPHCVAAADLSGDTLVDLVTANNGSNYVSVLLNHGDGTFEPAASYFVGGNNENVAVGDFNGDGHMDLALTWNYAGKVAILLNNGDGTFGAPAYYTLEVGMCGIAAGDLNGDGCPDLVVTQEGTNHGSLWVLLNNCDGTGAFHQQGPTFTLSGARRWWVVLGDFDGDSDRDVAVVNGTPKNTVSILFNDGNGNLGGHVQYPVGSNPVNLAAADLDSDGDMDLVVANRDGDNISVLLNNGDGTFAAHVLYPVGDLPEWVAIADLDGDGSADVAVPNGNSNTTSILYNHGNGTFEPQVPYAGGAHPDSVTIADLDADGDRDLAVCNMGGNVSVLMNTCGSPCPIFREDFPGPDLAGWQSIGNGQWTWNAENGGMAKQSYGPADDNLSALKLVGEDFEDFELTIRWRQDAGPIISSAMQIMFRVGNTPTCGNVPGLGPYYSVSWMMTPANYGNQDMYLSYGGGWTQAGPNEYHGCGGDTIATATLNTPQPWFRLGDWRRTRVRAVGSNIWVLVDPNSNNPAHDTDADFVPVFWASDGRLSGGTIALNDHYAKSSWDYVHVERLCGMGDMNCDGAVTFDDIDAFVLALSGPAPYHARYPTCDYYHGDIDGNGLSDFGDIDPFVALLTGS